MRKFTRKIELIGRHQAHDLLINNYGAVKFLVKGSFDLSGMIYCLKNSVEVVIEGEGVVSLHGVANRLILKKVSGDCTLDLHYVKSKEVRCELIKGQSLVRLGVADKILCAHLEDDAVLKYYSKTFLMSYSLKDNAKIEKVEYPVAAYSNALR